MKPLPAFTSAFSRIGLGTGINQYNPYTFALLGAASQPSSSEIL